MDAWKEDFIKGLREGKSETYLAKTLAGLPLAAVQAIRDKEPEFAVAWDEAKLSKGPDPKRELTPETLEALLWAQCSEDEIAAYFGMRVPEFKKRISANEQLQLIFETAPLGGRAALKRAQYENAINGNHGMQTWLGKQHLNQADKVEAPKGGAELNGAVTINNIFLRTLTEEQLVQLRDQARGIGETLAIEGVAEKVTTQ